MRRLSFERANVWTGRPLFFSMRWPELDIWTAYTRLSVTDYRCTQSHLVLRVQHWSVCGVDNTGSTLCAWYIRAACGACPLCHLALFVPPVMVSLVESLPLLPFSAHNHHVCATPQLPFICALNLQFLSVYWNIHHYNSLSFFKAVFSFEPNQIPFEANWICNDLLESFRPE